jgi:hypothetical protein
MAMNTTTKNSKLVSLAALLVGAASCGVDSPADPPAAGVGAVTAAASTCTGDWVQVTSPNVGGSDNSLAAVVGVATNDIWAVGQFSPDANPNITLTLAEHYDGIAWSVVDTPNVGTNHANALLAVAAQPGAAWAVGYDIGADYLSHSLIEAWDGKAWTIVDHPHPFDTENLYGVAAISARDVWAVGSGRDDQGSFHAFTLHFDGRAWSVVTPANPGTNGNVLYAVVANASDDVWAVGQKIGDAPPDQALLEHWNGRRWSEVASGVSVTPSTQLIGVDAVGADDVRAVGDAQDGVVSLRTFALSGEGTHFALQGTPDPNSGDNRLTGVAAVGDDQSWAVGSTLDGASGNLLTLIATGGEGSAWTQVASPSPGFDNGDSQLATLTKVGAHDLWAVGGFDGPDAAQTLVLHRCK